MPRRTIEQWVRCSSENGQTKIGDESPIIAALPIFAVLCSKRHDLAIAPGRNQSHHTQSDQLGIERWQLREAIHKIKAKNGLGPTDQVKIWDDGAVTDWRGDFCGDIQDEI